MKTTKFYNPEIPYSLHDMNVIEFEINGDNLIMRTQSGMVRTAPNFDQVDGYLEFLDVNWEYCYATFCEGYYGNLGTYEGKTFKKMHLKDFIAEFKNAGLSITDEYYGQNRALYTGYFHKGGEMGECTIEIYHNNIVFYEQTNDTHEMKLHASPFEMIKNGTKNIELRLYDEKRQQIKAGDDIIFTNTANAEKMRVTVKKLHVFGSFEELYENLPLLQCGYTEEDIDTAHPSDMEAYYSSEEQKKYGVVGIELCLPK